MTDDSAIHEERLSGGDVRQRAITGVATVGARGLMVRGLGLLGTIVLAHNLPPRDFGLIALGYTVVSVDVPPRRLNETLREWHRVLRPAGAVRVHVPNSPALMEAYLGANEAPQKWALSGALLGQYASLDVSGPADLAVASDHQILFDLELLLSALANAGFVDLVNLTEHVSDRHTEGWRPIVDRCSLVVEGSKSSKPVERATASPTSAPWPSLSSS